jgi:hypothetical protein
MDNRKLSKIKVEFPKIVANKEHEGKVETDGSEVKSSEIYDIVNDKITQCVEIGSPFVGLSEALFSEYALLEWLSERNVALNTQIA